VRPQRIVATLAAEGVIVAIMCFFVLPRLDWGADREPGVVERTLAGNILGQWIRRNANLSANPFAPTPENLNGARSEYGTVRGLAPARR
jgi:hypothetical protein